MTFPLIHCFDPLAIITRLTKQLQVSWPVRPAARQGDFMVDCGVNQQETYSAPTRKTLSNQQFVDVLRRVITFGFQSGSFTSAYINRTNAGVRVVPCFAGASRPFWITPVPMIACVTTAFFATSRRRVPWRIMPLGTRVLGFIQRIAKTFGYTARTGHGVIKPLSAGGVKL